MSVTFYDQNNVNGWLSNFYAAPIDHCGKMYPTSEHLYQSLKTINPTLFEDIRAAPTPRQAKKLAREFGPRLSDLDKVRHMRLAIRLKFEQHSKLRSQLMQTCGEIVEASPKDFYWGIGDGTGINMMGLLLMELRACL